MPTTRIKEKLSVLVNSQVPEFVRSEYSLFVKFLEYYYQYLEQDQQAHEIIQNARSYADIDETAASFIEYFIKNYTFNAPVSSSVDKTILVKRIKDIYEAKGSEVSFQLLFRLLFNQDVTINYPYENVLRPSDGEWRIEFSIRVETVAGDPSALRGRFLSYTRNNVSYSTPIIRTKRLTDTLYEFFLDPNTIGPYVNGDTVSVFTPGSSILKDFEGVVRPTTVSVEITRAGSQFKVGQIFNINLGTGVGTQVKIKSVNSVGGVTRVEIIAFGYNFTNDFSIFLDPTTNVAESVNSFQSVTRGQEEFISFLKNQTASTDSGLKYFDDEYIEYAEAYLGEELFSQTISNLVSESGAEGTDVIPEASCQLSFTLGTIARFPGLYVTNRGQISDSDIRLQDSQLYQPFAYQTETEIDITEFFDIVKQLIHPAGQNLFNNRVLFNEIDISGNVEVFATANIFTELLDVVDVGEEAQFNITKPIEDTVESLENANITISLNKEDFVEGIDLPEIIEIDYFLTQSEELLTSESSNIILTLNKEDTADAIDTPELNVTLGDINEELFFIDTVLGKRFIHDYTTSEYFETPSDYVINDTGEIVIDNRPPTEVIPSDDAIVEEGIISADYIDYNYILDYVDDYVGTVTRIFPYSNINIDTSITSTTDILDLANVSYCDPEYFTDIYVTEIILTV